MKKIIIILSLFALFAGSCKGQETNTLSTAKTFVASEISEDSVFVIVDKRPEFPGGLMAMKDYLLNTIQLPLDMQGASWQGRVIVRFIVRKTGKITDIEIVRSLLPSADKEAVRVVETMPDWIAGEHNGEKVDVRFTMPIGFKASDYDWILWQERSSKSELTKDSIYTFAKKMPEFPEGNTAILNYIMTNIKIPTSIPKSEYHELLRRGVFRFVVQKTGKISDIEIVRSIHPIFDKEVVRVIESMPDWIPAEHFGKKVNIQYTLPIHFNIQSD